MTTALCIAELPAGDLFGFFFVLAGCGLDMGHRTKRRRKHLPQPSLYSVESSFYNVL